MKKILAILIILSACKKKQTEPTPEPTPTPVVCKTGDTTLSGKWRIEVAGGDTITIRFKANNCTKEQSNIYVIDNFTTTIAVVSNTIKTSGTFTINSTEATKSADRIQKDYYFYIDNNGTLILNNYNGLLKSSTINFYKVL